MAENKFISQLSGITNPSLTGYTVYDDGITTYKMALGELTAFVTAAEGDFATTGSNIFKGNQTISGSLSVTGSVTSSFFVGDGSHLTNLPISHLTTTSSFNSFTSSANGRLNSIELKTGSYATTGSNTFLGSQTIKDAVIIGPSGSRHINNPEILHVQNSGSYNVAHFTGNHPAYTQINLQNINSGNNASADIVVTADNGTENVHYIDMGINSSTYTGGFVGLENDAYVINVGKDLYVGTVGGINHPASLKLFAQNNWEVPQINISGSRQIAFNTGSVSNGFQYEFSGSVKIVGSQVIQSSNPNANYISKFAGYDGGAKLAIGVNSDPNFGVTTDILNAEENDYSPYTITAQSVTINGNTYVNGNINANGNNITTVGGDIRGSNVRVDGILKLGSTSERILISEWNGDPSIHEVEFNYNFGAIAYIIAYTDPIDVKLIEVPEQANTALGFTVILDESTNKEINSFVINGVTQSIIWVGGTPPVSVPNVVNVVSFSMLRINDGWRVFGQLTTF
jgi:hypothetical protein